MKTRAALLVNTGKPLVIDEIEIPVLKPGQVLVKIKYSGVCHTQLLEARGFRGEDKFLPHCLGHEGTGEVVEISEGVKKVKPGDAVILSWIKGSGADIPGTVYQWNSQKVNSGAITTFGNYSVISENRLTLIPAGFSLRSASLLGCAIPTGFGSVVNSAQVKAGSSVGVFGVGGVGMSALRAASLVGAKTVIAIDLLDSKLETAKKLGATHTIKISDAADCLKMIKEICPSGLDYAIEATGRADVMRLTIDAIRAQGGTTVIIGNAHYGEMLTIDPKQFNMGKRILGTWGGDSFPDRDFEKFCTLLNQDPEHRLENLMISEDYSLDQVNEALDDLEKGKVLRPIINMEKR